MPPTRAVVLSALSALVAACGAPEARDGGDVAVADTRVGEDTSVVDVAVDDSALDVASDEPREDAAIADGMDSAVADVVDVVAVGDAGRDGTMTPDAADAASPSGPRVDRSMPQLYSVMFRPSDADPMAREVNGTQLAYLDTRVAPRGRLVVYLHGAGTPTTCGSTEHGRVLASFGFHVLSPCYSSGYGVGNCGANIYGCRLEAFEGVDHHPFITIAPADSIERRVLRGLELLARRNPAGDWGYFIEGGRPRWSAIVISGISHGASSSGVIAQVRPVERAVMLSGPLDTGQAWLSRTGMTAPAALWALTHTMDSQHMGHLGAFTALRLPGTPTSIDTGAAPWGGTHRFISSAMTTDGHGSTQAGGSSPRDAMGRYRFEQAWRTMYGAR